MTGSFYVKKPSRARPRARWVIALACFGISLSSPVLSQNPVPRVDGNCPTGTYRSGDYCKQMHSSINRGENIIVKSGKKCPIGFYSSGDSYCKQFSSSKKEVIPREKGATCPIGWSKSSGYCTKYSD